MEQRYQTAQAFRHALEARLKQQSDQSGVDIMRLRRMVAFDRLLARLFSEQGEQTERGGPESPWLLKGGYAMELRLGLQARATRDIDLTLPDPRNISPSTHKANMVGVANVTDASIYTLSQDQAQILSAIQERLQEDVDRNLGDWFRFRIGAPMAELDAPPYGGARFPVEALLANRRFITFHLDVGIGDATASLPEWIVGHDLLKFAGISPARIAVVPIVQQFAEKIHAYTLPRTGRENTRVRDLIDLVLLIDSGLPERHRVTNAIQTTFERRGTHKVPAELPTPPESWREQYTLLAAQSGVPTPTLQEAFDYVSRYWRSLQPTS